MRIYIDVFAGRHIAQADDDAHTILQDLGWWWDQTIERWWAPNTASVSTLLGMEGVEVEITYEALRRLV